MAEYNQNQSGMPNPNDDQANRLPQQAGGSGDQQGGGYAADPQRQQFDSANGQSGGSYGSNTELLDRVREDMAVIGPDGEECGRVDKVEEGRIKLTRHDSADGQHHYLEASQIEGIEGDEIRLSQTPEWTDGGDTNRAM